MRKHYSIFVFLLVLLFGCTYLIFTNKVEAAKIQIEETNRSNRKSFLEKKDGFFAEFSENHSAKAHLLNDFFDVDKARYQRDTLVSFFVYRSRLPITDYDEAFYDCLLVKCESAIENSSKEEEVGKRMSQLKRNYGELVDTWVQKIGQEKFLDTSSTNESCMDFFEDISKVEINPSAFTEFEKFLAKFKKDEKEYKRQSSKSASKYQSELNKAKNSLTSSGRKILEAKAGSNLVTESTANLQFDGDRLGVINYSFPIKEFNEGRFNSILDNIYIEQYKNNSLRNGAMPYAYCFGSSNGCGSFGCSKITVKTPYSSDVMVTIKKDNRVYRHAYIKANNSFTFSFPDGTYQAFFYYGKGWNPNKFMKETSCGKLKGGFMSNEAFGKDYPQYLYSQILTYELILQQNGNFSTKPSSKNEAF